MSARPQAKFSDAELLLAELRALRRDIAGLRAALANTTPASDLAGEELLQAIAAHAGSRVFSAIELVRHAALEAAVELREAIGGLNARQLGKRLRRLEGREYGGLTLHREGFDRLGVVWRVSRVSNSQNSWLGAIG